MFAKLSKISKIKKSICDISKTEIVTKIKKLNCDKLSSDSSDSCESSERGDNTTIFLSQFFVVLKIVTTQKLKLWQNLKIQTVTKLKKIVTRFKNLNCDKTQNSNCD